MSKEDFDGLYFLNCLRALPIFPLDDEDRELAVQKGLCVPYDLKAIVQGRRSAETMIARELAAAADETTAAYTQSDSESLSEEPAWAELLREQAADVAAEVA